mgnify:CR=1 FL=1
MKKLLCVAMLALSSLASAYQCTTEDVRELQSITHKQEIVLANAFLKGLPQDLGYTMMGIAWQESRGGKYLVNIQTNDFGVMGININSAANREGLKGSFSRNMLAQRLIMDNDYNMDMSMEELMFWKNHYKGNWRMMVRSYNAGYAWRNGEDYLTHIRRNVNMFMHCRGVTMEDLELLEERHARYAVPSDATHYNVDRHHGGTGWRRINEQGAYLWTRDRAWRGYDANIAFLKPIPIDFLLDRYVA